LPAAPMSSTATTRTRSRRRAPAGAAPAKPGIIWSIGSRQHRAGSKRG